MTRTLYLERSCLWPAIAGHSLLFWFLRPSNVLLDCCSFSYFPSSFATPHSACSKGSLLFPALTQPHFLPVPSCHLSLCLLDTAPQKPCCHFTLNFTKAKCIFLKTNPTNQNWFNGSSSAISNNSSASPCASSSLTKPNSSYLKYY